MDWSEIAPRRLDFLLATYRGLGLHLTDGYVLDLGCQYGALAKSLVESHAGFHTDRYLGLDLNVKALTSAKRLVPGGNFVLAEATTMPFATSTLANIFAISVLEHVNPKNLRGLMYELGRSIESRGTLAVQIPNPYFPVELHSKLPFLSYLPQRARRAIYRRIYRREMGFHKLTCRELLQASPEILRLKAVRTYWYPAEILRMPRALHKMLEVLGVFRLLPMGHLLIFKRY